METKVCYCLKDFAETEPKESNNNQLFIHNEQFEVLIITGCPSCF